METGQKNRTGGARPRPYLRALALAALALAGCHRQPAETKADATYTVRGEVLSLPAQPGGEMTVHHETVKDFVNRQGQREAMESMSMPFGVAPDVALSSIAPGDKVEMTFELRWQGNPPLRIVQLHELPADTPLELGGPTLEPVAPLGPGAPPITPAPEPAATPPVAQSDATRAPAPTGADGERTGRVSEAI